MTARGPTCKPRPAAGRRRLARLLPGVEVVVDACVVLLAEDGDDIVTSDTEDLRDLAAAAGVHVELVQV